MIAARRERSSLNCHWHRDPSSRQHAIAITLCRSRLQWPSRRGLAAVLIETNQSRAPCRRSDPRRTRRTGAHRSRSIRAPAGDAQLQRSISRGLGPHRRRSVNVEARRPGRLYRCHANAGAGGDRRSAGRDTAALGSSAYGPPTLGSARRIDARCGRSSAHGVGSGRMELVVIALRARRMACAPDIIRGRGGSRDPFRARLGVRLRSRASNLCTLSAARDAVPIGQDTPVPPSPQ